MSICLHPCRVQDLFDAWTRNRSIIPDKVSTLCWLVGSPTDELVVNQRGVAIVQYLFDQPRALFDTCVVAREKKLIIVSTQPPASFTIPSSVGSISVEYEQFDATNNATAERIAKLVGEVGEGGLMGVANRELALQVGTLSDAIKQIIGSVQSIDTAVFFGSLLEAKDAKAIEYLQKACALATSALKRYVVPELEAQLSTGKMLPMSTFSANIQKKLKNASEIPGLEALAADAYEPCFEPVAVQSGGKYDLKVIQENVSSDPLRGDCVVIAYGVRHYGFSSYLARTFLVEANAPKNVSKLYEFIISVSNKVMEMLVPGKKTSEVHAAVLAWAKESDATLAQYLTRDFGFGTGMCVMENRMSLGEKGTAMVAPGMCFVVRVGLENVPDESVAAGSTRTISLVVGDTVFVRENGAQLITKQKRDLKDILYLERAEEAAEASKPEEQPRDLRTITRGGKTGNYQISNEEERRQKQARIIQEKRTKKDAVHSFEEEDKDIGLTELGRLAKGEVASYTRDAPVPKHSPNVLEIDRVKETVWIPVCGCSTPFHVSTISKVDLSSEGGKHTLTITFCNTQESNPAFRLNRKNVFIKTLIICAKDGGMCYNFSTAVREVMQRIKQKDTQRKQNQGVVQQTGLQLNKKSAVPRLHKVKMRPPPATGKNGCQGDLEAHDNGFRFQFTGGEPIVILYSNVKHVIFQPSDNDICVTFHITLKQPILVRGKKCEEVQFVAEVLESSEGTASVKRSYEDELRFDEVERERVRKTNSEYLVFSKNVESIFEGLGMNLKVQLPFKEFDFKGSTSRSMTRFRANKEVVWAVTETPFFTQALCDVEVVSLERIVVGGQNIDIVFILKDYKTTVGITAVPMQSLDSIKDWLCQSGVVYFESNTNIQWTAVLKEIRSDAQWDPWSPEGWQAYIESDDEGDDDEDDDDTDYETDEDEEAEDDDSDSDWAEEDDSEEPSTDDSDGGVSWDEMEKRAADEDRKKGYESDSDGDNKRKKARTEGRPAAAAPAKRPTAPPKTQPGKKAPVPVRRR